MEPKVVILGGGPSAAFAFKACKDYGIIPKVYANNHIVPYGAFWLHWLPKTIASKTKKFISTPMEIRGIGFADEYARKMWGVPNIPTSFPEQDREVVAYNPFEGLKELWKGAELSKVPMLSDGDIKDIASEQDLVIQTFPSLESRMNQPEPHLFKIETKYVTDCKHGICEYNGLPFQSWVRVTLGFGRVSFEFPPDESLKELMSRVYKRGDWHISIVPDMHPDTLAWQIPLRKNILLAGRYARWERKFLAHETYGLVTETLLEKFGDEDA